MSWKKEKKKYLLYTFGKWLPRIVDETDDDDDVHRSIKRKWLPCRWRYESSLFSECRKMENKERQRIKGNEVGRFISFTICNFCHLPHHHHYHHQKQQQQQQKFKSWNSRSGSIVLARVKLSETFLVHKIHLVQKITVITSTLHIRYTYFATIYSVIKKCFWVLITICSVTRNCSK